MSDYGLSGFAGIGRVVVILLVLLPLLLVTLGSLLVVIRRSARRTGKANRWLVGLAAVVGLAFLGVLVLFLPYVFVR